MIEAIAAAPTKVKHHHWLMLGLSLIASGLLLSLNPDEAAANRPDALEAANRDDSSAVLALSLPPADGLEDKAAATAEPREAPAPWQTVKVKHGDNLSLIFARLGLSPQLLYSVLTAGDDATVLKDLRPGQLIKLRLADSSGLLELMYDMDPLHALHVWHDGADGFKSALIERPVERRTARASGVISRSLFESAQQAGLSDGLTMKLAGMFGWDIDFALDIREGDRFSVVYDDLYLDGKLLRHGDILAAEFVNDGTVHRAIRYTDPDGRTDYYSPDGKSMRKAFLRTPVEFSRISSHFTTARYHPILNRIRAHNGVDYAAPAGTPVKATGDGKVVFIGGRGGYGEAIVLQHGARYSTLYGHLSRFARHLHRGSRVHQGQVIGYVGMTGLATGPHLHYEFRIDGVHRNPLKVHFPEATPLPTKYRPNFIAASRGLMAQLDAVDGGSTVALNDSAINR